MQQQLQELERHWCSLATTALASVVGFDAVKFQPGPANRFRLLNWRVWCLRYGVPLQFVARIVCRRFESQRRSHGQQLGFSVALLTGPAARAAVQQAVKAEYVAGENFSMLRSTLKQQMLALPPVLQIESQEDGVASTEYIKKVAGRRRVLARSEKRFPRPWRGNPWR